MGWGLIMFQLALSGASPIYRGYLTDVDCRWNLIAGSVDDRTEEERGLRVRHLHYSSISQLTRRLAPEAEPIRHPKVAV